MPKEKYSFVTEIFEHSQRIGQHYGLYDRTCFQTRVRSIDWDDDLQRWHVTTNRDDDMKARFVDHGARHDDAGRSCPASRASTTSRATRSTPAAGTTTTPAATRPAA